MTSQDHRSRIWRATQEGRWAGIEEHPYKSQHSSLFSGVSRFPLITDQQGETAIESRYFEIEPGGYSSLEFHRHTHTVIPIRGHGSLILGNSYQAIYPHDVIYIDSLTLHQFLADRNEWLGFLCVVPIQRDRPQYPTEDEINTAISDPDVRDKIRT